MDTVPMNSKVSTEAKFHEKCNEKISEKREQAESSLKALEKEKYNHKEKSLEESAASGNVVKGLRFTETSNLDLLNRNAHLMPKLAVANTASKEDEIKKPSQEGVVKIDLKQYFVRKALKDEVNKASNGVGDEKGSSGNAVKHTKRESFVKEVPREDEIKSSSEAIARKRSSEHIIAQIDKLLKSYDSERYRDDKKLGKRFEEFLNESGKVEDCLKTLDDELLSYDKRFLQKYDKILKALSPSAVENANGPKQNTDLPSRTTMNDTIYDWVLSNSASSTSQPTKSKLVNNEERKSNEVKMISKEGLVSNDGLAKFLKEEFVEEVPRYDAGEKAWRESKSTKGTMQHDNKVCEKVVAKLLPVEKAVKKVQEANLVKNVSTKNLLGDTSKTEMVIKCSKEDFVFKASKGDPVKKLPYKRASDEWIPSTKRKRE